MSNLGPLPTDYQVPLECARDLDNFYKVTSGTSYYFLQGNLDQTSCFPSGYDGGGQYYSPAQCPSGFTPACQTTAFRETIIRCCPTQRNFSCRSTTLFPWHSTLHCVTRLSTRGVLNFTVITPGGGITSQEMNTFSAEAFNAYSVQVRYQSTDFLSTTTSSGATPISPTSTDLSTPTSSTLTASDMPSNGNQDGISAGAAVGIAVGAFAGLLIVVAVVWYLIRRKARQQQIPTNPPSDISSPQQQHSYLPPLFRVVFLNRKNEENRRVELPGQSRLEIPQELDSNPHPPP